LAINNINRSAWGPIRWTENRKARFNPVAGWVMIRVSFQAVDDKKIYWY